MNAPLRRLASGLRLWHVLLLIASVKLLLLAIDHQPRVFLGDSASYLVTALINWVPDSRSYTYGRLIALVTGNSRSLINLIWLQTSFTTVAAMCVAVILHRYLSAPVWLAGVAGLFCAIEPLQLMSERFVMSEPPALFFFALYVTLAFRYLKRGDILSLLIMPPLAAACVSFRVAFLPCILFTAFVLPFLSNRGLTLIQYLFRRGARSAANYEVMAIIPIVAIHFALSVGLTTADLNVYKAWYGELSNGPPAYIQNDGAFLLSQFSPLVEAGDFPDSKMGKSVLAKTTVPLTVYNRAAQMFSPNGLVETLRREIFAKNHHEDMILANRVSRQIAISSAFHHPIGCLNLTWATAGLYFDRENLRSVARYDEFRDLAIDPGSHDLLTKFGFPAMQQPPAGPVVNWHYAMWPWFQFLIIFPPLLFIAVLLTGNWRKPHFVLLVPYSAAFLLLAVTLTHQATPRFEMPLAWLFPLAVGALFAGRAYAVEQQHLPEQTIEPARDPTRAESCT